MIDIIDKNNCTGCGACINACSKRAISFREDSEGFIYPIVDKLKCIDCHLCEKVCPFIDQKWKQYTQKQDNYPLFFAGQLKEKNDLQYVSSGGAFWAFVQAILSSGGIVYGAVQKDVDNIFHVRATNLEDASEIRRSKYFQSDTNDTFVQVKADLISGKTVLFSGTGCQIAGLASYLRKNYSNLYTCDVVCHGVPSHEVWKAYRKEKEAREGKTISGLVFRDKSLGWSKNQYKITYTDGSVEYERSTKQLFHAGYLKGLFYRPSCGNCQFATLPRVADLTLADFWKYKGKLTDQYPDLGVSLITVNSSKGYELLRLSSNYLDFETTDRQRALLSCRHLGNHPKENPDRAAFFKLFFEKGYYVAAEQFFTSKRDVFFVRLMKKVVRQIKN